MKKKAITSVMTKQQKEKQITSEVEQKTQKNYSKKKKTFCSRCGIETVNDGNNTNLCDTCNEYYGTEN